MRVVEFSLSIRRGLGVVTATIVVGALALLVGPPTRAQASTYGRAGFGVGLTAAHPGASTGFAEHILYQDEHDPNAKPKTFHKIVVELPEGMRFDTGVVPNCNASDDELMLVGAAACPAGSNVGGGGVTVVTGFGPPIDPSATDVTTFQGPPDQLIDLITFPGTGRPLAVDRIQINGRTLTDEPAPVPGGPPDWRTAVRKVDLSLQPRSAGNGASRRAYITTPAGCPASGAWVFGIAVYYDDGITDTAVATAPCSRTAATAPAPVPPRPPSGRRRSPIRLAVSPQSTAAGTRVPFRFHLTSRAPACRRGVVIRFAGRRAHTNRRGYVTVLRQIRRPGLYRALATKRGCGSADVHVRITGARAKGVVDPA
jgi:hypothetical protein